MKYIKDIPKTLLDDFVDKRVVPIVGAGFSKNASIPNEYIMPDWNQLGKKIGEYIPNYEFTNALDSISLFESHFSRVKLIELLSELLHINQIKPGNTHHSFCDLFFDTICTTNFDFLLEHTLQQMQKPHSIIVSEERLAVNTDEKIKLIKLHGDFNHPQKMVITEGDYDAFIENNRILATYIANIFITRTLFLVGYSFEDIDTRNIWKIINERLGGLARPAYVVMVDANPIDIIRFERRNVKVINLKGKKSEYSKILNEFFLEIKTYVDEKSALKITTTSEKAQGELKLPAENKRLCFVSMPYNRASYLRELIYPVLERKGYTPITSAEVIMPGESWMAKSEAILKEASMVVVDISGNNDAIKWELVSVRNMGKDLIIIEEEGNQSLHLASLEHLPHITYNMDEDNQHFINRLEEILSDPLDVLDNEPARLLQKKEYDAAVISAFRLLELKLREKEYMKNQESFKTASITQMLKEIHNKEVHQLIEKVLSYIKIRNQIVHGKLHNIGKKKATEIVQAVEALFIGLSEK